MADHTYQNGDLHLAGGHGVGHPLRNDCIFLVTFLTVLIGAFTILVLAPQHIPHTPENLTSLEMPKCVGVLNVFSLQEAEPKDLRPKMCKLCENYRAFRWTSDGPHLHMTQEVWDRLSPGAQLYLEEYIDEKMLCQTYELGLQMGFYDSVMVRHPEWQNRKGVSFLPILLLKQLTIRDAKEHTKCKSPLDEPIRDLGSKVRNDFNCIFHRIEQYKRSLKALPHSLECIASRPGYTLSEHWQRIKSMLDICLLIFKLLFLEIFFDKPSTYKPPEARPFNPELWERGREFLVHRGLIRDEDPGVCESAALRRKVHGWREVGTEESAE